MMAYYGYGWRPYVPVAQRRREAHSKMKQLRKKGLAVQPVTIQGRNIAKTFWGKAWCNQMESLGDFANRLPRGRTYVRNGSVCHLNIKKGRVSAIVSGSTLYNIRVSIKPLPKAKWTRIKRRCAGQIGSLIELLQGKLSSHVMEMVTDCDDGLFPTSSEITLDCDCPDWAHLCKHLAAVLYGVGARLDEAPELLFLLRGVNHEELIDTRVDQAVAGATSRGGRRSTVASSELADVFGIELAASPVEDDSLTGERVGTRQQSVAKKKVDRDRKSVSQKKKHPSKTRGKNATKKVKRKAVKKKSADRAVKKETVPKRVVKKKGPTKKTAKKKTAKKMSVKKKVPKKKVAKKKAGKKSVKKRAVGKRVRKTTRKKNEKGSAARKSAVRKKGPPKKASKRRPARKHALPSSQEKHATP